MSMKKSIAVLALTVSASSFALQMPPSKFKTACLSSYEQADGSVSLSRCDEAANNKADKKELLANGCAEGQSALTLSKYKGDKEFSPVIYSCLPSNVIQL